MATTLQVRTAFVTTDSIPNDPQHRAASTAPPSAWRAFEVHEVVLAGHAVRRTFPGPSRTPGTRTAAAPDAEATNPTGTITPVVIVLPCTDEERPPQESERVAAAAGILTRNRSRALAGSSRLS